MLSKLQVRAKSRCSTYGLACLALFVLAGCAGGETDSRIPDRNSVSGTVTLDGETLPDGSISFSSAEDSAKGIRASTSIIDGRYKLPVTPGTKKVTINRLVDISELKTVEKIPAKYNSKTTLEANVSSENNIFDFELKTK